MERCFIVTLGIASSIGYDEDYYVCKNHFDAKELVQKLLKQQIEDGDYTQEEIDEILEDGEESYYETYTDIEEEWFIRMDTAEIYEGGE